MNSRFVPVLVVGAFGGMLAGVRLAFWPLSRVELPPAAEARTVATPVAAPALGDSFTRNAIARDPFRFTRRPAATPYDPLRLAEQLAPPAPKPMLTLLGLVAGADPTAVIQGLPGVDGPRVLRLGDQVAGITLRRVSRDSVRLVGMDTTWLLTVRHP